MQALFLHNNTVINPVKCYRGSLARLSGLSGITLLSVFFDCVHRAHTVWVSLVISNNICCCRFTDRLQCCFVDRPQWPGHPWGLAVGRLVTTQISQLGDRLDCKYSSTFSLFFLSSNCLWSFFKHSFAACSFLATHFWSSNAHSVQPQTFSIAR